MRLVARRSAIVHETFEKRRRVRIDLNSVSKSVAELQRRYIGAGERSLSEASAVDDNFPSLFRTLFLSSKPGIGRGELKGFARTTIQMISMEKDIIPSFRLSISHKVKGPSDKLQLSAVCSDGDFLATA